MVLLLPSIQLSLPQSHNLYTTTSKHQFTTRSRPQILPHSEDYIPTVFHMPQTIHPRYLHQGHICRRRRKTQLQPSTLCSVHMGAQTYRCYSHNYTSYKSIPLIYDPIVLQTPRTQQSSSPSKVSTMFATTTT